MLDEVLPFLEIRTGDEVRDIVVHGGNEGFQSVAKAQIRPHRSSSFAPLRLLSVACAFGHSLRWTFSANVGAVLML